MCFFGRTILVTTTPTSLYDLMVTSGVTSPPFVASQINLHPELPFANPIYIGDFQVSPSSFAHHFDSGGKAANYSFTAGEAGMKLNEIFMFSDGGNQNLNVMIL